MANIEKLEIPQINSLSQGWPTTDFFQRYFLLDEFTKDNPQRLENLRKNFPVVKCFIDAITGNRDSAVLEPVKIRFSENASSVYLCFANFAEGPRIDHLGEMMEGHIGPDGTFSIMTSETLVTKIPRTDLQSEISRQIKEIQTRVPPKQKPF